jgi:hypothetical protein
LTSRRQRELRKLARNQAAGGRQADKGADEAGAGSEQGKDGDMASSRRRTGAGETGGDVQPATLKSKLRLLLRETRSFKERLGMSAILAGAISFSFIFFGICDIFATNHSTIPYHLTDVVGAVALETLVLFAVLTALLMLARGRVFDYLASFFFGLLLMMYIQGNFLNIDLGQLTGDRVQWENYRGHAVANSIVCLLIVLVPFVLRHFSAKAWRALAMFIPAILIIIQLISLLTSFSTTGVLSYPANDESYLSSKGLYQVSGERNTVVFILDRLDERYVQEAMNDEPELFANRLDGFTHYTNNLGMHSRTYPAVINMLTGANYRFEYPSDAFAARAWEEGEFLPALHGQGYTNFVYTEKNSGYFDASVMEASVDNVEEGVRSTDSIGAAKRLTVLSLYRYAPHAVKANFWMSTDALNADAHFSGDQATYTIDDAKFYRELSAERLVVSDEYSGGLFKYIHLNGSHPPFTIDRFGNKAGGETSSSEQTRGAFRMVFEYIDQLKELGLYDGATIVITGDHGYTANDGYTGDWHPLREPQLTSLFYKPAGSFGVPMRTSSEPTTVDSLRSTLLDEAGMSEAARSAYPTLSAVTYPQSSAATLPERDFYYRIGQSGVADYYLQQFSVGPDATDFTQWREVEMYPIQYWQY